MQNPSGKQIWIEGFDGVQISNYFFISMCWIYLSFKQISCVFCWGSPRPLCSTLTPEWQFSIRFPVNTWPTNCTEWLLMEATSINQSYDVLRCGKANEWCRQWGLSTWLHIARLPWVHFMPAKATIARPFSLQISGQNRENVGWQFQDTGRQVDSVHFIIFWIGSLMFILREASGVIRGWYYWYYYSVSMQFLLCAHRT